MDASRFAGGRPPVNVAALLHAFLFTTATGTTGGLPPRLVGGHNVARRMNGSSMSINMLTVSQSPCLVNGLAVDLSIAGTSLLAAVPFIILISLLFGSPCSCPLIDSFSLNCNLLSSCASPWSCSTLNWCLWIYRRSSAYYSLCSNRCIFSQGGC